MLHVVTGAIPGMAGDGDEGIRKDDEMDVDLASLITAAGVADDDDDDDDVVADSDSDGDGDDMYGDLGDEGAIDEPEEEGEKDIEDLHKDLGTEDSTTSGVKEKSLGKLRSTINRIIVGLSTSTIYDQYESQQKRN